MLINGWNKDLSDQEKKPLFDIPDIREYFMDLEYILEVIADGPTKSFAFRRLGYLASKFTMYSLLNESKELAAMKVSSEVSSIEATTLIRMPIYHSQCLTGLLTREIC